MAALAAGSDVIETLPAVGVPAEPTTPILPSQALKLGRLVRPRRIEGNAFDGADGACAMGAMAEGGYLWGRHDLVTNSRCPICLRVPSLATVAHLNDDHHWSDNQIVAWLQSLGL